MISNFYFALDVFQALKCRFNIYLTILATYFISSYLHGFNVQIWAVLLTLGFLTQVEFKLRKLLSKIFFACIESKKCVYDYYDSENDGEHFFICRYGHTNTNDHWPVRWINFIFSLNALFNLAFLGSTFDGQSQVLSTYQIIEILILKSYFL